MNAHETPVGNGGAQLSVTAPLNGPAAETWREIGADVAGVPKLILAGEGGERPKLTTCSARVAGGDVNPRDESVPVTLSE